MKKISFILLVLISICLTPFTINVEANDDLITLPTIAVLKTDGTINSADFSPDDKYIVTGDSKGNISIWNAVSNTLVTTWNESRLGILKVIYSPNGEKILSHNGQTLSLWDVETGKLSSTFEHAYSVTDGIFSEDGKIIYAIHSNDVVYWDLNSGEMLNKVTLAIQPDTLTYNAKLNHLAIGLSNGDINILDARTGEYIKTVQSNRQWDPQFSNNYTRYSNNYDYLYSIVQYKSGFTIIEPTPNIYAVHQNYKYFTLNSEQFKGYKMLISDFTFSPNDKYIALYDGYNYRTLVLFDVDTKLPISSEYFERDNGALAFNNKGNRLIANNVVFDTSILPDRKLREIKIEQESGVMLPGQLQTLKVVSLYSDGTQKNVNSNEVKWTSSTPSVAKFLYGKLEALEPGVTTITAEYEGYTATIIIHVQNYKEEEKKENVEVDKIWNVKFNQYVDIHTIKEKNIYITDEDNEIVSILYYVEKGQESNVQLIPTKNFTPGAKYTLWVKNVNSQSGNSIKEFVKMDFTIQK